MKIRLPKWSTVLGAIMAAAAFVVQHQDAINAIPGNTSKSVTQVGAGIVGLAGLLMSMYGTPPHANTPEGGVATGQIGG